MLSEKKVIDLWTAASRSSGPYDGERETLIRFARLVAAAELESESKARTKFFPTKYVYSPAARSSLSARARANRKAAEGE